MSEFGMSVKSVRNWNARQIEMKVRFRLDSTKVERVIFAEGYDDARRKLIAYYPERKVSRIKITKVA